MEDWKIVTLWIIGIAFFLSLIFGGMWGCPKYNVWQKELSGKAKLKEAEWSRQIEIKEAQAELEAANYKMQTDSTRAEGVAIANKIIAESLTQEYIQWRWVEGLHDGSSETIYIPTEANIPIMEANRRK